MFGRARILASILVRKTYGSLRFVPQVLRYHARTGGGGCHGLAAATEIHPGDWLRMRLEIDLAANGGNGLANAFYKDLTLGQTDFTPIPGIQNKSANLLGQPAANKYFWDRMYLRGGINVEENTIDNLEVGLISVIPEPASMLLVAMGAIGLLGYRGRKG